MAKDKWMNEKLRALSAVPHFHFENDGSLVPTKKINDVIFFSASYASVLTILSFSLERYLAICTPLYIFPLSDIQRAALVSSLCWTVALLASVPHLLFTKINYIEYPYHSGNFICDSAFCAMLDVNIEPSVNQNMTFN